MEVDVVAGACTGGVYLGGPCGAEYPVAEDTGDGGASSSATTNRSCSRSCPPNAMCTAPGWTHMCSHGTENLSWNEPSTAVRVSRVMIGCFSGDTESPPSLSSYNDGSRAYSEIRTVRFVSAEDQKGCNRASRFACQRWRSELVDGADESGGGNGAPFPCGWPAPEPENDVVEAAECA